MGLLRVVLLSSLFASSLGCNKPDPDECRKACWNFMKLQFWDQVDQEVKDLSPEAAAKIRAEKELEFKKIQERQEDPGHQNCTMDCQQKASKEQVACLKEASSFKQAEACLKAD